MFELCSCFQCLIFFSCDKMMIVKVHGMSDVDGPLTIELLYIFHQLTPVELPQNILYPVALLNADHHFHVAFDELVEVKSSLQSLEQWPSTNKRSNQLSPEHPLLHLFNKPFPLLYYTIFV